MASNNVVRLVCADCLRTAEPDRVDNPRRVPVTCQYCGGTIEAHVEHPSDEFVTPLSLELTPEEAPWAIEDTTAPPLPTASQIGRFQIRERLGGGGFGDVYRAYDPRLDRDVALKVLKDPHPTARLMERFFREARAAARLDHASIVPLHDAGRDEGRCWISYQYIEGKSLDRVIGAGVSTPDYQAMARLIRNLAEGLDHSHRRGVVHRDVKPANIILDDEGQPRLTDFGLARRTDHMPTITIEGAILGTPAYMSPEQAAGQSHQADARSDVYSLGIVFYELLCGDRPADMPSDQPSWRTQMPRPATPPRHLVRSVPRELDRICLKAISFDPADRYPDARSLALDLEAWLNLRHAEKHRPIAHFTAAALVVGSLLAGYSGAWLTDSLHPEERFPALNTGATNHAARPPSPDPKPGMRFRTTAADISAVVTKRGSRIFHAGNCASLAKVADADRENIPLEKARAKGYYPCSICLRDLAFHTRRDTVSPVEPTVRTTPTTAQIP